MFSTNEQMNATTDGNFPPSTTPEQDKSTKGPNATEPDTTTEGGTGGGKLATSTESSTDKSNLEQEGTNSLPVILSISIVVTFLAGIAIVGAFLMIGWCVCKRKHKQRRLDLNALSIAAPMGIINTIMQPQLYHIVCSW